jgi:hypothetical protein
VAGIIGTLDVEEKARAKDTGACGNEGGSNAHVCRKEFPIPQELRQREG